MVVVDVSAFPGTLFGNQEVMASHANGQANEGGIGG